MFGKGRKEGNAPVIMRAILRKWGKVGDVLHCPRERRGLKIDARAMYWHASTDEALSDPEANLDAASGKGRRKCSNCRKLLPKGAEISKGIFEFYTDNQWRKGVGKSKCNFCVADLNVLECRSQFEACAGNEADPKQGSGTPVKERRLSEVSASTSPSGEDGRSVEGEPPGGSGEEPLPRKSARWECARWSEDFHIRARMPFPVWLDRRREYAARGGASSMFYRGCAKATADDWGVVDDPRIVGGKWHMSAWFDGGRKGRVVFTVNAHGAAIPCLYEGQAGKHELTPSGRGSFCVGDERREAYGGRRKGGKAEAEDNHPLFAEVHGLDMPGLADFYGKCDGVFIRYWFCTGKPGSERENIGVEWCKPGSNGGGYAEAEFRSAPPDFVSKYFDEFMMTTKRFPWVGPLDHRPEGVRMASWCGCDKLGHHTLWAPATAFFRPYETVELLHGAGDHSVEVRYGRRDYCPDPIVPKGSSNAPSIGGLLCSPRNCRAVMFIRRMRPVYKRDVHVAFFQGADGTDQFAEALSGFPIIVERGWAERYFPDHWNLALLQPGIPVVIDFNNDLPPRTSTQYTQLVAPTTLRDMVNIAAANRGRATKEVVGEELLLPGAVAPLAFDMVRGSLGRRMQVSTWDFFGRTRSEWLDAGVGSSVVDVPGPRPKLVLYYGEKLSEMRHATFDETFRRPWTADGKPPDTKICHFIDQRRRRSFSAYRVVGPANTLASMLCTSRPQSSGARTRPLAVHKSQTPRKSGPLDASRMSA